MEGSRCPWVEVEARRVDRSRQARQEMKWSRDNRRKQESRAEARRASTRGRRLRRSATTPSRRAGRHQHARVRRRDSALMQKRPFASPNWRMMNTNRERERMVRTSGSKEYEANALAAQVPWPGAARKQSPRRFLFSNDLRPPALNRADESRKHGRAPRQCALRGDIRKEGVGAHLVEPKRWKRREDQGEAKELA